jgi:pyruvate/2-oxoglutarate dehydrogenase complex dihydrolipoamide dehydrogenase (E3) component
MSADASTTENFDAIIIGSGQGGNPLAEVLIAAGKKTAMIERKDAGGTCINTGCTPTKTMVASARVAYLARRGSDYGVDVGPIAIDMSRVRERKRNIVSSMRQSREKRLANAHVELIRGEASFTGSGKMSVALRNGGKRQLTAPQIFINTGTHNALPAIEGLDTVPHLDNESIMELDRAPEHLLIIGGGYIGIEFSQMFRRFGSKVTVIQAGSHLLHEEDPDVAAEVTKILREDGIEVLLNAHTQKVAQANGVISLTVMVEGKAQTVEGTDLLVATGRVPNTHALNPAAAGIETDEHGFIRSNERLETTAPGVWVIGDVKGGPQFTHISMTWVARAIEMDESRGLMKAVVDADTEEILGATVLGIEGGEVMTVIQMAMMGHLKYSVLQAAVLAHPTLSESLNNLFLHFDDEK